MPAHALLQEVARNGGYTDCYLTAVPRAVSHAEFVAAFYTTWLFRLERFILAQLVGKPSTDDEAHELARGERERFAAWSLDARSPDQLVMLDFQSRTCSWLMVEPAATGTTLYFGTGILRLTGGFRALLLFHRLYSRALLATARSRLNRRAPLPAPSPRKS
ncbi:MAG TPA: hypothetical protein VMF52_07985 [Steroidobacteraceae bacterium]|nr:hypothetical protein [Steroidobacteraceae bacterium]